MSSGSAECATGHSRHCALRETERPQTQTGRGVERGVQTLARALVLVFKYTSYNSLGVVGNLIEEEKGCHRCTTRHHQCLPESVALGL